MSKVTEINNTLGDFLYAIAPNKISSIIFKSAKEIEILLPDDTTLKIRERTPYKMWTRAIFEVNKL